MRIVLLAAFLLAPTLAPAQAVEYSYGPGGAQKLDLVTPKTPGFATVIFVHGGSMNSGDKADSDYGHACDPFPAAGLACASANYRLAPEHAWPTQAEDVAAAIAWVRDHIAGRGGDPHKLFLLGHSSGALLVAVVGSDERYLAKHGMKPADLRGVMPMGSIMWDEELEGAIAERGRETVASHFLADPDNRMWGSFDSYWNMWPIRHVHAGLPPFLFLIAEAETEQPPVLRTDAKFADDARKLGSEAKYKVFPGRKHYTMIRQLHQPGDAVFAVVVDFVHAHSR
jgi:acetyl esterase/lipase